MEGFIGAYLFARSLPYIFLLTFVIGIPIGLIIVVRKWRGAGKKEKGILGVLFLVLLSILLYASTMDFLWDVLLNLKQWL